jgi:ribonuclease D
MLLQLLRTWRAEEGASRSMPLYMIASNKTLEALAANKPTTERQLKLISGIGPKMIERYGDELLGLIREHTGEVAPMRSPDELEAFLTARDIALSEEDLAQLRDILK